MHQPRHRHVRIFTTRISHVVRRRPCFFDPRNDLTPNRIAGIIPWNQVEKVWRNGEREFVTGQQNAAPFFFAEIEMLLELSQRVDPVFELPFPIIPEFRRDPAAAGPVTGRVRDELFPIAIPCGKNMHCVLRSERLRALTNVSTWALLGAPRTSASPACGYSAIPIFSSFPSVIRKRPGCPQSKRALRLAMPHRHSAY